MKASISQVRYDKFGQVHHSKEIECESTDFKGLLIDFCERMFPAMFFDELEYCLLEHCLAFITLTTNLERNGTLLKSQFYLLVKYSLI